MFFLTVYPRLRIPESRNDIMAGFVQNLLWNSVEGFVEAGTRTVGGYAGDALIKAGDLIENSGRSVGNGIERRATGYGTTISGQTYQPAGKPLPSTARKPALKRSNSSPAATKSIAPSSKTPIGAKKNPPPAVKQFTNGASKGVNGASKSLTNVATKSVNGAQKSIAGSTTGGQKAITGAKNTAQKSLPKPYPNNVPYSTKAKPSASLNNAKGTAENKAQNLPKPYGPQYPTEKKTAVKPGQPRPFTAPTNNNNSNNNNANKSNNGNNEKKPYPGTNTLPGQASKTPVKKYKPLERMQGTAEKGKVQHITV